MRIRPTRRSGCSSRRSAARAPRLPSRAKCRSRSRLMLISAVSVPEKNAESAISATRATDELGCRYVEQGRSAPVPCRAASRAPACCRSRPARAARSPTPPSAARDARASRTAGVRSSSMPNSDPCDHRKHDLVDEVLREQVLDEERAAHQCEREQQESGQDRLEAAGLERFERREDAKDAERPAAAQPPVDDDLCDGERRADRQHRERGGRDRDVKRELPAGPRDREVTRPPAEKPASSTAAITSSSATAPAGRGPQHHVDADGRDDQSDDRRGVAERQRDARRCALSGDAARPHERRDRPP